jgi:deoxyribodipyrimidine photo-lyase
MKRAIYWLRNDLRLHDNVIFYNKLQNYSEVLPVYILDRRIFESNELGSKRIGEFRKTFLRETLLDLQSALRNLNSNILIKTGNPSEIIPELARRLNAEIVFATKEHTQEEINFEYEVESRLNNTKLELVKQITLIDPKTLPFGIDTIPDIFTDFRKSVEKSVEVEKPYLKPRRLPKFPINFLLEAENNDLELLDCDLKMDNRSAYNFIGGETEATNRLIDYIWDRKLVSTYKNTRNQLLGESYSSKFSPWLALGSLSPRLIYDEVKKFENLVQKNISTYWLIFELLWRDYFRFVAMKYGNRIFQKGGIKNSSNKYENDIKLFHKWMNGETGNDFVDANMTELNTTGFMSNRGRQNVASYLIHDLNIDWRWGAEYFESKLIDYDVCSNWGNWMYIAGVGNDPRPNRKFNVDFQARKYDANEKYRNYWLNPVLFN